MQPNGTFYEADIVKLIMMQNPFINQEFKILNKSHVFHVSDVVALRNTTVKGTLKEEVHNLEFFITDPIILQKIINDGFYMTYQA